MLLSRFFTITDLHRFAFSSFYFLPLGLYKQSPLGGKGCDKAAAAAVPNCASVITSPPGNRTATDSLEGEKQEEKEKEEPNVSRDIELFGDWTSTYPGTVIEHP